MAESEEAPPEPPKRTRKLSSQARRTLRRRALDRSPPLERQIARGRADTRLNWCGEHSCTPEKFIYETPMHSFADKHTSKHQFQVLGYHRDFVRATVENVFPDLVGFTAKAAKVRAIMAFVDSPPVRTAFWRCRAWCFDNVYKPTRKDLQTTLMKAMPEFRDLMFGPKNADRVRRAHGYISPDAAFGKKCFSDVALQFLIRVELWRRHDTCRSVAWTIGTASQVAEFQTALLANYWYMFWDGCFVEMNPYLDASWDRIWEEWLDEYPVWERQDAGDHDGRVLVVRQALEATQEEMLENVGYLGGIGKANDVYKPVRDRSKLPSLP